jgi:hypothetical protein
MVEEDNTFFRSLSVASTVEHIPAAVSFSRKIMSVVGSWLDFDASFSDFDLRTPADEESCCHKSSRGLS